MIYYHILACSHHNLMLDLNEAADTLQCPLGCIYIKRKGVFRFVENEEYASSFGIQWNKFRLTQLDSYTGLSISRDRLTRISGGSLEVFKDKIVLEAGCGAGRFTEIMLQSGAKVFAVDLSNAVEANFENNGAHPEVFICQADLLTLPVFPEQFDIVVCVGVIQHTPNPEETMKILYSHVKPGGILMIDHYSYGYPVTPVRKWLRQCLLRTSEKDSMRFVEGMVKLLWPLHRVFYKIKNNKIIAFLRPHFYYWSPVVDYCESYPQLSEELLYEWAILDTHDTLTDRYKHLRSIEEIEAHLKSLGMRDVVATYGGNGVEARAIKPIKE